MQFESVHVYTQRPIEMRQVYKLWILSDRDYDVARTKDKISKHCIPVIRSYFLDSTQRALGCTETPGTPWSGKKMWKLRLVLSMNNVIINNFQINNFPINQSS